MAIGGLVAHTFRLFLGNPDIMVTAITWIIFATLLLTVVEIGKEMNQ